MVSDFWAKMIDEYASKWEREYGQFSAKSRDVYNWGVKLLQVLQVLRRRHGSEPAARAYLRKCLSRVFDQHPTWPPSPAEFKSLVLGGPQLPWGSSHRRFAVERLPASTRADAEARAARELPRIADAIASGRMSREEQVRLYESMRKPVEDPAVGV